MYAYDIFDGLSVAIFTYYPKFRRENASLIVVNRVGRAGARFSGAGGLRFKSRAGQIGQNVANVSPAL